jgi:hypothetical protein
MKTKKPAVKKEKVYKANDKEVLQYKDEKAPAYKKK